MAAPASGHRLGHYAAPAAFLAAVTIAVLLIRSGLGGGPASPATTVTPVTHPSTVATPHPKRPTRKHKKHLAARYYVVQSGDTFGSIAAAEGTTVAQLEQLNPGVSSSSLSVGQRIRVK